MNHLKSSLTVLMLLTSLIGSRVFAQDLAQLIANGVKEAKQDRANEITLDNEYASTGFEEGVFFSNPLMLNGKPLDYSEFNLGTRGELTVTKGAATTGRPMQIPFYVYLKRKGNSVLIPGKEKPDPRQIKIEISEILRYAEIGDQLVIEAVKKEDGPVKRILKLLGRC